MEENKKSNVIGVAEPVLDEVENIGVINPDILKKRERIAEEAKEEVVEEATESIEEKPVQEPVPPVQTMQQQSQQQQYQQFQQFQQFQQNQQGNNEVDQNKKILAGLMGIFFGAFGVHNFIYGYTGKGVAQVLITVLSCFMLSWVSGIWGFIEGIMILTDSIKPNN